MLDRFKSVGEDDSTVAQTRLKYRPSILFCPLGCDSGVVLSQLKEIAEKGYSWYFWKILDFRRICGVQVSGQEVGQREYKKRLHDRRPDVDQFVKGGFGHGVSGFEFLVRILPLIESHESKDDDRVFSYTTLEQSSPLQTAQMASQSNGRGDGMLQAGRFRLKDLVWS